jgi:putative Mg2+ transporter-C (MgtC) family protein
VPNDVDLEIMVRLSFAALLGALIGAERQRRDRTAGLRTYMLVAIGAALFGVISLFGFRPAGGPTPDATRIAAQVVTGIGFLGAGVVLRDEHGVRGVTTAAGIWAMAAIGLAAGAGMYWTAAFTTVLVLLVLLVLRQIERVIHD